MADRKRMRVRRPIENVASGATWDGKGRRCSLRNAIREKEGRVLPGRACRKRGDHCVAQSGRYVWGATYRNKEYILLNMERDK
jgi:hypothetical protein